MPDRAYDLHGARVLECAADGPLLRTDRDATDVIGEAMGEGASVVVLPVERLGDDFFELSTRIAGELLQKFVNYRIRVAITGDISEHIARSGALRDFVYESNRGNQIWFLSSFEALAGRLASQPAP